MTCLAVVDAGPLHAAADADDQDHLACRTALARTDLRVVVPALVIAEATYFVGRTRGDGGEQSAFNFLAPQEIWPTLRQIELTRAQPSGLQQRTRPQRRR